MRGAHGDDIPIRRAGFSLRSPFAVLILLPFYLPLILSIFGVSVVFTIWPDALEHSPISFEAKGVLHHVWHYSLMLGSLLVLVGLFWASLRRLTAELAGLFVLMGGLTMNLLAVVALTLNPAGAEEPAGLGMALRAGVIISLAVRAYIIVFEPTVSIKPTNGEG